jgi:Flp pilus assembly protein TadG
MGRRRGWRLPGRGHHGRGQSLVEFALTLPVLMLVLVMALDFGRVFLGWISLNNVARIAATYGAENPSTWVNNDSVHMAEYQTLIGNDLQVIDCTIPTPYPTPDFASGTAAGGTSSVHFTCQFHLITPLVGNIVGDPLAVAATAVFPIVTGQLPGATLIAQVPSPTPSSTATPTPAPTASADATPSPTPVALCVVPDFVTGNTDTTQAAADWTAAGFQTNLIFSPQVTAGNAFNIKDQSVTKGLSQPCLTTVMTVYSTNQH